MLHAILIDDEASARTDLRRKLAAHGGVTVVGEAATLGAARALLASADYDLVLLDVQLIGGDAFELVHLVRPDASIVFATVHERFAARAFESRAIDYLLKPIEGARLAEALRRAADARSHGIASANSVSAVRAPLPLASATAPGAGETPVAPDDVVEVELTSHERSFLRQMVETWEDSLPPGHVLRVQPGRTRTIRYVRNGEPTQLFLVGAPASVALNPWRALWARIARMMG